MSLFCEPLEILRRKKKNTNWFNQNDRKLNHSRAKSATAIKLGAHEMSSHVGVGDDTIVRKEVGHDRPRQKTIQNPKSIVKF